MESNDKPRHFPQSDVSSQDQDAPGSGLLVRCGACGASLAPIDRFCSLCGALVRHAPSRIDEPGGDGGAVDDPASESEPQVFVPLGATENTLPRRRRSRKKRWFRRPLFVIPLAGALVIAIVGSTFAYRTMSTFDTVNSLSTPPSELSGAALGGDEGLVIDTNPALVAIQDSRDRRQQSQDSSNDTGAEPPSNSESTQSQESTGPSATDVNYDVQSPDSAPSRSDPSASDNRVSGDDVVSTEVPGNALPASVAANAGGLAPGAETRGTNVLLMGVDARDGQSIDVGVRPDSLAVLHLDDSGACRLLAIPRDSRAELPGYGQSKVNHALAVGGIEYEMLVIENYLGIELDHYGLVDFEGVTQVVDTVGGITVENPLAFTSGNSQFPAGEIQLNGEQALAYARFRGDAEGDFGRISRQQQVLRALLDRIAATDLVQVIPQSFSLLQDHFRTDFGLPDLLDLSRTYRSSCTSMSIETKTIPGEVTKLPDDMMQMDLSFVVSDPTVVRNHVRWLIGDTPTGGSTHHELLDQHGSLAFDQRYVATRSRNR